MLESLARLKRLERQVDKWLPEAEPPPLPSTELPGLGDVPLLDLIPRLSPQLEAPHHLGPLVSELELAIAERPPGQRFFWFSVPPRHWKTFTLRNAVVKHLAKWPTAGVAYISHTQLFASKQSREIRKLGVRAGFKFARGSNRQDEWELQDGGGLVARGMDGEVTGRGFRLIVIDDPIKDRDQANSQVERGRIFEKIEDDIITRLDPDGALFLVHTRWHPDDPIGRYKKLGWRGTNIKSLGGPQEDQALLPHVWPFEHLDPIRKANVYKFASLYQGEPRPRGGARFNGHATYEELPKQGNRVSYGIDLAYTSQAQGKADFSVCLKMIRNGDFYYVVDVQRAQIDAPGFTLTLASALSKDPGPMLWYCSGTEKGSAQFIQAKLDKRHAGRFRVKLTTSDKYQRSEKVSEAWNLSKVLVPGGENRPAWVDDFVDEITNFTGVKDTHDDQVDALAAAFDLLNTAPPKPGNAFSGTGRPRMI